MIGLLPLLALMALILTLATARFKDNKFPLWPAVLLVCVIELLRVWQ